MTSRRTKELRKPLRRGELEGRDENIFTFRDNRLGLARLDFDMRKEEQPQILRLPALPTPASKDRSPGTPVRSGPSG
jgi:hypothetical protein